ncbi:MULTISPECIES: hypothetical protein [unclassified Bradyrhizobium]|uniref:hypothetical protein n=1 Tax=unclassified Bradyrhizobium TaxID=2631580 RepID=UPI00247A92EA|nr:MULTISPECIES: hypothetical protein [unclassified Bradyrhizobium]WGR70513.1 hypothetical protein MTX24_35075 [Bradyrhizobium sp. ISRA426]WGR82569.1 hypothetical protein MTX21_20175 [Bradyrhizobium sp. ISRA430]WGR85756.1 hypothetical protein MTX25_34760 [Bradyrhizobium sp. ISRA432]
MDDAVFEAIKSKLDAEIDGFPETPIVGIKLGWDRGARLCARGRHPRGHEAG